MSPKESDKLNQQQKSCRVSMSFASHLAGKTWKGLNVDQRESSLKASEMSHSHLPPFKYNNSTNNAVIIWYFSTNTACLPSCIRS